jgi:hypothetical protein
MKKLFLFIAAVILLSCEIIEDPPKPVNYYCVVLQVNSTSGKVISNEIISDFVFERESIEKWSRDEGISTEIDSINHITTIKIITHLYPDPK